MNPKLSNLFRILIILFIILHVSFLVNGQENETSNSNRFRVKFTEDQTEQLDQSVIADTDKLQIILKYNFQLRINALY